MASNTKEHRHHAPASEPTVTQLAERLFAGAWTPNSGYTVEHLAEQCIEAAEAFQRVSRERAN